MRTKLLSTAELNKQMEQCWTASEVADLFGVSRMTVHNWATENTDPLPAVRVPGLSRGSLRFLPQEVVAWGQRNQKPMSRRI